MIGKLNDKINAFLDNFYNNILPKEYRHPHMMFMYGAWFAFILEIIVYAILRYVFKNY